MTPLAEGFPAVVLAIEEEQEEQEEQEEVELNCNSMLQVVFVGSWRSKVTLDNDRTLRCSSCPLMDQEEV